MTPSLSSEWIATNANLYGQHLLCTQDLTDEALWFLLRIAKEMKNGKFDHCQKRLFANKTFLMFFYNPSVRTHLAFSVAATQLGGHAEFFKPHMTRLKAIENGGESIKDAIKVMSSYVDGIGLRLFEAQLSQYGEGHALQSTYAQWSDVPVINLASDRFHPCQGLADIMTWAEWYGNGSGKPVYQNLKGKNLLLTWAKGELARCWCSVQEALLIASRFGMNITIARPDGYDLEPETCEWVQQNCRSHNASYRVINDPDAGYEDAHVVYSRHWVSPQAYEGGTYQKQSEVERALKFRDWIVTTERMQRTDRAIYTHCMPVDRGNEVVDEVADSSQSVIYAVAANRLHIQKAVLATTMSQALYDMNLDAVLGQNSFAADDCVIG